MYLSRCMKSEQTRYENTEKCAVNTAVRLALQVGVVVSTEARCSAHSQGRDHNCIVLLEKGLGKLRLHQNVTE